MKDMMVKTAVDDDDDYDDDDDKNVVGDCDYDGDVYNIVGDDYNL